MALGTSRNGRCGRLRLALHVVLGAVLVGLSTGSSAHSWYPRICCNEIDCMVVTSLTRRADGALVIAAGHIDVIVPPGFPIEPSEDRDAHVCVYRDVMGIYHPRCVFLPAET